MVNYKNKNGKCYYLFNSRWHKEHIVYKDSPSELHFLQKIGIILGILGILSILINLLCSI